MNTMSCEKHLGMGTVQNCAPCLHVELDYVRSQVRELRAAIQHSDGMQSGALRLKRIRDLRLEAIRDAVNQSKGDDLVRREVEWFLDCDASELHGCAALSSRNGGRDHG